MPVIIPSRSRAVPPCTGTAAAVNPRSSMYEAVNPGPRGPSGGDSPTPTPTHTHSPRAGLRAAGEVQGTELSGGEVCPHKGRVPGPAVTSSPPSPATTSVGTAALPGFDDLPWLVLACCISRFWQLY